MVDKPKEPTDKLRPLHCDCQDRQPTDNACIKRVLKVESHRFKVDGEPPFFCTARKKVKKSETPVAGDFVRVSSAGGEQVIEGVLPRKNYSVRPQLANLDQLVIVAAPVPQPDFFLLDKLLLNARRQNLDSIICVNKSDLGSEELIAAVRAQYGRAADKIIVCSALGSGGCAELEDALKGKLSAFAGQSAVGKSSLTNSLTGRLSALTGDISQKLERGRNTTTSAELYKLCDNTYIADTPGFSMLDLHSLSSDELDLYYAEFAEYMPHCRFNRCSHTAEPDCAVKKAVESGALNALRYARYVQLRAELKEAEKNLYR